MPERGSLHEPKLILVQQGSIRLVGHGWGSSSIGYVIRLSCLLGKGHVRENRRNCRCTTLVRFPSTRWVGERIWKAVDSIE